MNLRLENSFYHKVVRQPFQLRVSRKGSLNVDIKLSEHKLHEGTVKNHPYLKSR